MIFAIIRQWSGNWDFSKPIEEQPDWLEHAEYMDRQHAAGRILLAGPLGGGPTVLLVIRAESADAVRELLAEDVWTRSGLLEAVSMEPWTLRLGSLGQTSSTSRP